jgi:hypothetical protein
MPKSRVPAGKPQPRSDRSFDLFLLGIVSMTIDHIGAVFFPQVIGFRVIGRLALPIFAYGVAEGYRHTRSWENYFLRLVLFGSVAQFFYMAYFGTWGLNIMFLLAISVAALRMVDTRNWLGLMFVGLFLALVPVEYGLFGIIMAMIYYYLRERRLAALAALVLLVLAYSWYIGWPVQSYAAIGAVLALFYRAKIFNFSYNRWFFYVYYPGHLAILLILKYIYL